MSVRTMMNSLTGTIENRLRIFGEYRRVFQGSSGDTVLSHIAKVGGLTKSSFVAGDPHMTAFNEGKRHLALSIIRAARKDESELTKLIERGLLDENQ